MLPFQKQAKQLEKFLHLYTVSIGAQLKPLPNPVLRSLRHGILNGAGKNKRQESSYCMGEPAVKKPNDNMTKRYNNKELAKVVREIFNMCGKPVGEDYAKQLVCLNLDTAQQCVTLLGEKRGGKLVVRGTAIYRDFDRTDIISSDGNTITMNLVPKSKNNDAFKGINLDDQKLIDLNLVCKNQDPSSGPAGLPLVLFVMWDAFKRKRRSGHKYDGIYLTVAADDGKFEHTGAWSKKQRTTKTNEFHKSVRQQANYNFFKRLGFKEIRGLYTSTDAQSGDAGTDVVETGEWVATVKMVFLWKMVGGNMLDHFKKITNTGKLFTLCTGSYPRCL